MINSLIFAKLRRKKKEKKRKEKILQGELYKYMYIYVSETWEKTGKRVELCQNTLTN